MILCAACRNQDYEGELFCTACGARLAWGAPNEAIPTITFDTSRLRQMTQNITPPPATVSRDLRPGQIAVVLGAETVLLEGRPEYVIGREGADNETPDVNLGPHGGRERGVSRRHALLRVDRRQLLLTDLESANGTWLNGSQIAPHEPARLESGDQLRLGKFNLKVYFNL